MGVFFSFVTDTYSSSKCGTQGQHKKDWSPFDLPRATVSRCYPNGAYSPDDCAIDDSTGILWFQRIKQYLIANGVAVVVLNPYELNEWQYNKQSTDTKWEDGTDRLVLQELFKRMSAGNYGPSDMSRVVFRGWSGGAAMVSWIVQQIATGGITGVVMKAGVYMSGGS